MYSEVPEKESPINDYLKDKLSILSFISILFVVLIHSCRWEYFSVQEDAVGITYELEHFLYSSFSRFAVPYFFFCSGFLLCAKSSGMGKELFAKLKKRSLTLALPWFLWLVIGIVFYWVSYQILNYWLDWNLTCPWEDSSQPIKYILQEYVWGDTIVHLWFLKRLMLFMVLSPIFIYLIKKMGIIFLFIVMALALTIESSYINDHFCCFIAGLSFGVLRVDLRKRVHPAAGIILFLFWIIMCFYCKGQPDIYIRNFIGVAAVWGIYDVFYPVIQKFISPLLKLSVFSFFIYCLHPYPLFVFDLFFRKFLPREVYRFSGTLLLTFFSCLAIGYLLKRFLNPVYKILSGNR